MGQHHIDDRVDQAFIRLQDELCSFERATSRGGLLIYIPENKDEPVLLSWGGKPQAYAIAEEAQQQEIRNWFTSCMDRRYNT